MLYERTAISKKTEQPITNDIDLLRSEYQLSPEQSLILSPQVEMSGSDRIVIGAFEAGFKGQMELYLRYLEKYEKVDGENTPIRC